MSMVLTQPKARSEGPVADIVFGAVKQHHDQSPERDHPSLNKDTLVVSIAAGVTTLISWPVHWVMTANCSRNAQYPSLVNAGMTSITFNALVTTEDVGC